MVETKTHDRINQGYYDELGKDFGEKVRERIHWICSKIDAGNVLDVGCSQGITSILLGREGIKVLGVDSDQETIKYANSELDKERETTKKNVIFECVEFIGHSFGNQKFHNIIAAEILEHLTNPERFINKFSELLEQDGKLIVTVPYGINKYFDHKKTYFFSNLIEEIYPKFNIIEYKLFGKWLGIICEHNKKAKSFDCDIHVLKGIENIFFSIEQEYLRNVDKSREQIKMLNVKLKEMSEVKSKFEQEEKEKQKIISKFELEKSEKQKIQNKLELEQKEKHEIKNKLQLEQKEKQEIKVNFENEKHKIECELVKSLNSEKSIISEFKLLKYEIEELRIKNSNLDKEYNNLRNSKLGKLQTKYWKLRNRK